MIVLKAKTCKKFYNFEPEQLLATAYSSDAFSTLKQNILLTLSILKKETATVTLGDSPISLQRSVKPDNRFNERTQSKS